ncbi:MAG: hypothetical protein ACRD4P_11635 [Bryobacteraceae bacterium]
MSRLRRVYIAYFALRVLIRGFVILTYTALYLVMALSTVALGNRYFSTPGVLAWNSEDFFTVLVLTR